jgi:membrane-bound lytic murein transglycosylase B
MIVPLLAAASLTLIASEAQLHVTAAQLEAAQYGRILGAAAQCRDIDPERLRDATHHASLAVRALASTSQEFESARGSFANAAIDGGNKVNAGQESCEAADQNLHRIERGFAGN